MSKIKPKSSMQTPRFADVATFFRLPIIKDLSQLDYCICGIPWDGGTTNRPGARHGPREIRNASSLIRTYHPSSLKSPYDKSQIADIGDCPVNPADLQDSLNKITSFYNKIAETKTIPLSIGGDHLISLPILRALAKNKPLGMFQFDSHSDTWDTYFGAPYTHGTPFRRAREENLFLDNASMHVGIRGPLYSPEDLKNDAEFGFKIIHCDEFQTEGIDKIVKRIRDRVGNNPLYLSIDIDVLDPAFAPGTGTPEVAGMTTREIVNVIRGLSGLNLISADVVEVSPAYDHAEVTSLAAATIVYELTNLFAKVKG